MNIFNRIMMILLSLAALAFGVIELLLLTKAIQPINVSPGGVLLPQWSFMAQFHGADVTTATIVSIILAIVGLIIIILEVIPGGREQPQFVVKEDNLGQVTVARSSVRDLVQHEAMAVPEVIETRQTVGEDGKGLRVHVRSSLSPDADAPQVGQMLQERIQESLQRHIGLPVVEVRVETQIQPLDHRKRRRVR